MVRIGNFSLYINAIEFRSIYEGIQEWDFDTIEWLTQPSLIGTT